MIILFPDETVVSRSDGDKVILTPHRIWYENKESGRSYNQSIMLEHITSCENHSYSNNFLLSLAAFFFFIGVYASIQENSTTFVVLHS
jgi:Vacuolar protein sorting protein 36 Vps36